MVEIEDKELKYTEYEKLVPDLQIQRIQLVKVPHQLEIRKLITFQPIMIHYHQATMIVSYEVSENLLMKMTNKEL